MRGGSREQNQRDALLSFDTTLPTSCPGLSAGRTLKEMRFPMSIQLKYVSLSCLYSLSPQLSWPSRHLIIVPGSRNRRLLCPNRRFCGAGRKNSNDYPNGNPTDPTTGLLRPAFPWTAAAISPASAKSVVQISPCLVTMRTRLPRCKQPSARAAPQLQATVAVIVQHPQPATANPRLSLGCRLEDSDLISGAAVQMYTVFRSQQPYQAALRVNGARYVITSA